MKKKLTNNFKVLLIDGSSRQVMPLIKSFYDLGCHITTLNSSKLDMGYSSRYPQKKLLRFFSSKDPARSLQSLKDVFKEDRYDLLIPLNDFAATVLSKNKDFFHNTCAAVNDYPVFEYACDKLKTMKVCMEHNIPCPKTILTEELNGDFAKDLVYPVVVKPRTGYAAVGFSVVDTPEELPERVRTTTEKFGPALVQEYIPQTGMQYKCEIFVDDSGTVKSAVVFAKIRWYPVNGGSSTLNETVDRPDIIESCTKLLHEIKWKGYADIDLIQDPRDNIAKIMEINPRITGSVKICYAAGVNFSKQLMQYAKGEEVDSILDYRKGVYLRYLHTDILWFLKSKNRFSARPSWFSFKNVTDQIFSPDDPIPFITYSLQGIVKLFHEKARRSGKKNA